MNLRTVLCNQVTNITNNVPNENLINLAGSTLLIIDDRPHNLLLLSKLLLRQGYQLRKALSGAATMKTLQTQLPDLILLNMQLRDMSGYEVCTTLKANPETCSIPIIFIDVPTGFDDVVKIFSVGGSDYITEPLKVEEILVRVKSQLTIKKLQTQLAKKNAKLKQEILTRKRVEYSLNQLNITLSRAEEIVQRGQV